jgi:hypothetical protein
LLPYRWRVGRWTALPPPDHSNHSDERAAMYATQFIAERLKVSPSKRTGGSSVVVTRTARATPSRRPIEAQSPNVTSENRAAGFRSLSLGEQRQRLGSRYRDNRATPIPTCRGRARRVHAAVRAPLPARPVQTAIAPGPDCNKAEPPAIPRGIFAAIDSTRGPRH